MSRRTKKRDYAFIGRGAHLTYTPKYNFCAGSKISTGLVF